MATTPPIPAPPAAASRPMRGDAARNRERVLAAAKKAFAVEGADVQMEHIARRAGVGVGTLYRNFPTKQALIAELGRQWLADRVTIAEQALAMDDAGEAFAWFIRRNAEAMAADAGMCELLADLPTMQLCRGEYGPLIERTEALLARARRVGAVRPDLTVDDFQAILIGLSAAITRTVNWRMFADMLIAGMRAPQSGKTAG